MKQDEPGPGVGPGVGLGVGEMARLAGVTVRTLHHYESVGLLRPSARSSSGYRRYGPQDVERLRQILGYRDLGFGLAQIAALLDARADPAEHLRTQRRLLTERLDRVRRTLDNVEKMMDAHASGIRLTPAEMLEVFGDADPAQFTDEVEQRWGGSEPYTQSRRRTEQYSAADWTRIKAEGDAAHQQFAAAMAAGEPADGERAMAAAQAHREHIGRWFYDVPVELHTGLADMYLDDPRFTKTYEDIAPGLARYVHDAIYANAIRISEAR
jgi:MerR family transcriptional regulator, thiopeptide resistance regulator